MVKKIHNKNKIAIHTRFEAEETAVQGPNRNKDHDIRRGGHRIANSAK